MKIKQLCCKPKNHPFPILSWLIMWLQGTNYSHHAIQYGSLVIDATGKDVRVSALWEFEKHYEIVDYEFVEIDASYEQFVNWCLLWVNRSYGFFQLIGVFLKLLKITKTTYFGKEERNLICSELIILLLRDFKGLKVKDSDEYDLNSTWDLVKKYGVTYDDAGYTC